MTRAPHLALVALAALGCDPQLRPRPDQVASGDSCEGMFVGVEDEATLAEATRCRAVQGALIIFDAQVDSLRGLEKLEVVGRDVVISYNERIQDLRGLSSLHTIGGALIIVGNPGLRSLEGLDGLKDVNAVDEISSATISRSFDYEGVGGLGIVDNANLETVDGLQALETIGGDLWIVGNPALHTIDAIPDDVRIEGDEVIRDNGQL